jgi:hypothetical protein
MRLVIPLDERTRLEQRLGAAIPPPSTNAFKTFLNELKVTNPDLAAEIEGAVRPLGIPSAVRIQANKARENARLASVWQRLFMKQTSDGFVVDKAKIGAWSAGFAAVALLIGVAALAVKPAPPSSLSLAGVLGNGDAPQATQTPGSTSGAKPSTKPTVSNATRPEDALKASSFDAASQGPSRGPSQGFPSPKAVARSSRPTRPAADVRTTSYVVRPSNSGVPAASSLAPSTRASGSQLNDGPSSSTVRSTHPSVAATNEPRPRLTSGAAVPRPARPIPISGSPRPPVPNAAFSIQSVAPAGAAATAPGRSSVASSSATTPTASGLAISVRDASGLTPSAATPTPAGSAPGLGLGLRDQPAPPSSAAGGIGISSLQAHSRPATNTPAPSGGIGLTATTPAVSAQNGFPGATTAPSGSPQAQPPQAQPGGLFGAPTPGLESVLPNLYTGMKLEATLTVALVAVEQHVAPFVAVTKNPPCGRPECPPITWIGQALLGPDRRVWVLIDQASYIGQTYAVKGQALGLEDARPGLAAEVGEEAPTLVSDLLRGGIGAFSDYLSAQLGAKTITLIPGGGATQSGTVPDLVNFFGGRAASLVSLPADARALIRVARVAPDSRLLVLYGVPVVLGGGQR